MDLEIRNEEGGSWKEILDSKYKGWRELRNLKSKPTNSIWWRDLRIVVAMEEWGKCFEDNILYNVREGKNIRVWDDK